MGVSTLPERVREAVRPCESDRGVVVQERAGETHVLAVAADVRVVGEDVRLVAGTVVEYP